MATKKPTPKRNGRPSKIDKPAVLPDGQLATTAEAIVSRLRAGSYFEHACASVGIHRDTANGWIRTGADITSRLLENKTSRSKLTAHETRCLDFSVSVREAEASWVVRQEAELERAARGGQAVPTVTEKFDGNGNLIERTVRTDITAPDAKVTMWRLERKHPDLYGRRTVDVNVGGQPDNPLAITAAVSVESLAEKIAAAKETE